MQSHHKNTFRTKHDGISSKLIAKQLGLSLYMVTPGGQIPKCWPKMIPNIGIMQMQSNNQTYIQDKTWWYFFKINYKTVGVTIYMVTPGGKYQDFDQKWPKYWSWMYFCGYFALSNVPNWEVICIIPIFGIIFGQHLGIWPPGVTIYMVTPTVWQLILKKYHHALSWMYFCGYFALSNGPNWDVIWIIPIFGVGFGQTVGSWPPGVTIYRFTTHCFAVNFE
jgi:hypothetical protein